jgi:hypothetical protein
MVSDAEVDREVPEVKSVGDGAQDDERLEAEESAPFPSTVEERQDDDRTCDVDGTDASVEEERSGCVDEWKANQKKDPGNPSANANASLRFFVTHPEMRE